MKISPLKKTIQAGRSPRGPDPPETHRHAHVCASLSVMRLATIVYADAMVEFSGSYIGPSHPIFMQGKNCQGCTVGRSTRYPMYTAKKYGVQIFM